MVRALAMRRWSAPLGLGLLVIVSGALVAREREADAARTAPEAPVAPSAPSTTSSEPSPATAAEASEPAKDAGSSLLAPRRVPSFDVASDGSPVPALDAAAPRRVKLGVALFRYRGAEGAGSQSRSREDAERLALAALAKGGDDFGQVVALGDPGSAVDVGWVGRGVLERAVEYPIFTAQVGQTLAQPIDTPRGYWVVRRHK